MPTRGSSNTESYRVCQSIPSIVRELQLRRKDRRKDIPRLFLCRRLVEASHAIERDRVAKSRASRIGNRIRRLRNVSQHGQTFLDPGTSRGTPYQKQDTRPANWKRILTQFRATIQRWKRRRAAQGRIVEGQGSAPWRRFSLSGTRFSVVPLETERGPLSSSLHLHLALPLFVSELFAKWPASGVSAQSGLDRGEHRDFTTNRCNFAERFTKIRIDAFSLPFSPSFREY